jgi:predicted nucleotidyltransferase
MDATPVLVEVARALREQGLEAILIGSAAAALQGAPVTTIDLDFLIRKTQANTTKLENLADALGAVVFRPHYPVSGLYRVIRDDDSLQLDFMTQIHGARSFNSLRSRAVEIDQGEERITVASLADIVASKRAAERPRLLRAQTLQRRTAPLSMSSNKRSGKKKATRAQALEALKRESELALEDQIRRLLAKPMNERTHFLRRRIGIGASAL